LRGNVDTRIRKLQEEDLGAIILASAGLRRLGLSEMIRQTIPIDEMLPAIGQGALGLELRRDDRKVYALVGFLNHESTALTVRAERAFLKELQGGCQVPIAGYARLDGDALSLEGLVAELDGSRVIRDALTGTRQDPEAIGIELADRVLAAGADRILEAIYSNS
jgi:hydroxymethylbilane synthase